jgi:hypothetical protein
MNIESWGLLRQTPFFSGARLPALCCAAASRQTCLAHPDGLENLAQVQYIDGLSVHFYSPVKKFLTF